MKTLTPFAAFSLAITIAAPLSARVSDPCTEDSQCSAGLICIQNNCLPDGAATVTISWTSQTDVDIELETPDGITLSPNLDGQVNGSGGRMVRDECYVETCRGDDAPLSHPNIEHIVFDDPTEGTYLLSARNFDGFAAANLEVTVRTVCGDLYDNNYFAFPFELDAVEDDRTFKQSFDLECVPEDDICDDAGGDTDGDALCDDWETDGIDVDNDGTIDFKPTDADPNYKDLYIEIDWLKDQTVFPATKMIEAFAAADVDNPNGEKGINLHILYGEEIDEIQGVSINGTHRIGLPTVPEIKWSDMGKDPLTSCGTGGWFGTAADRADSNCANIIEAKKLVYRYVVFAHRHVLPGVAGQSELPGNDSIITAGYLSFDQADLVAVLMHEFGHALGLYHGGSDHSLCKPNHLSIMNYIYTLDDWLPTRPLTYSQTDVPTLFENALLEDAGINGPASWPMVIFGSVADNSFSYSAGDASDPIDWNNDADTDDDLVGRVSFIDDANTSFCDDKGRERALHSQDDWKHLRYNFRDTPAGQIGAFVMRPYYTETIDIDGIRALAATIDSDNDGVTNDVDVCPGIFDDQADQDNDGVGDACDACPEEPAPSYDDGCFQALPNGEQSASDLNLPSASETQMDDLASKNDQSADKNEKSPSFEDDDMLRADRGCSTAPPGEVTPLLLLLAFAAFRRRSSRY